MASSNYQEALDRVENYKRSDGGVDRDGNKFYERGGNEVTYAQSLQMRGGGSDPVAPKRMPETNPARGGAAYTQMESKPAVSLTQNQANAGTRMESKPAVSLPQNKASAGTSIQDGQTPGGNATFGGVTDYNQISQQFQNWNPTSDWGKTMQATYMMNTLQSYNDMQQAQSMAFTNAGIQMDMMTATAALELANKGALLNAEQQAALNMMGAQFDYESRFAQDDYNRDVGKATLGTDLQIQLMQAQGDQTRANYQVQGFEERMGLQEQGNQTRLTQAQANIEKQQQAAQAAELGMDTAAFQQGLQKDTAGYVQGLQKDTSQFNQELSKDSAAFSQALEKDSDTHRSGIRKDEAGYGSELRIDEARVGSDLRKDEAGYGSELRVGEARVGSELRKDEAGYGSGLRKDEAGYGSELRKDEAGYGSELRVGEARVGSDIRKDEAGYGSGLRKDEARLGSALRKDEAVKGSDLRIKEADYANRLEARTRANQSKYSTSRARGF